jgi:hypothetical protein
MDLKLLKPGDTGIQACTVRLSYAMPGTSAHRKVVRSGRFDSSGRTRWCLWCSGNTLVCGARVTGSTPVRHPDIDGERSVAVSARQAVNLKVGVRLPSLTLLDATTVAGSELRAVLMPRGIG